MHITKKIILTLLALSLGACAQEGGMRTINDEMTGQRADQVKDEFVESNAADPSQGDTPQAVGFYSQGNLINAFPLAALGNGFLKISQPRKRNYGTYDLSFVISWVAQVMKQTYPSSERLQVGDMSAQQGGQLSHHASHQNGLDADIVYFRKNKREMDPNITTGFDESFVKNKKVTSNFDVERNWYLFSTLVKTGRVKRIFVDPVIKTTMCEFSKKVGRTAEANETLRRLRVISNHADHLHLRINCPRKSPNCQQQVDPPVGSGC